MDNLNLDSDESVIFKEENLIISGVGHEAIFTGKRLILIESGTAKTREDIPYTEIDLAASGTNTLREPVITITARSPDGIPRETELIFIHQAGGLNIRDRDRCIIILRDLKVPVVAGPSLAAPLPVGMRGAADTMTPGDDGPKARPAVPEMSIFGLSRSSRELPPEESSGRSTLVMIAVVFLVLGVVIAGIFLTGAGKGPGASTAQKPVTSTESVTTPAPGQAQSPASAPVPTATTIPAWVLQPGDTPQNGIWVRITYPGRFTGSLTARGWNSEVNSTGTYLYQLPVHDTTIEVLVEKMDGSAGKMDVEILNGGAVISKSTTIKPYGTVDLHVDVGPAVISKPEVTVVPTVVSVIPTPDTSLVLHEVPATGVWVRVAYPGKYTGTIAANGIAREVNSSGDQIYQFPMTRGTVDAFMEKEDGSEKNMILQVYKDGALVTYDNTTTPLGVVEIHTTV
ncbi:MAG: hypothetical protein PHT99_01175 [Methanoregula sp.]|nr:hypothetical protein [Methanoregula sp.]